MHNEETFRVKKLYRIKKRMEVYLIIIVGKLYSTALEFNVFLIISNTRAHSHTHTHTHK